MCDFRTAVRWGILPTWTHVFGHGPAGFTGVARRQWIWASASLTPEGQSALLFSILAVEKTKHLCGILHSESGEKKKTATESRPIWIFYPNLKSRNTRQMASNKTQKILWASNPGAGTTSFWCFWRKWQTKAFIHRPQTTHLFIIYRLLALVLCENVNLYNLCQRGIRNLFFLERSFVLLGCGSCCICLCWKI